MDPPVRSKINQNQNKQIVSNVTTAFGNGSATSINGPVSIATIYSPRGISIHPITQEVYIAEYYAGNIRGWNRTSQTVRTVVSLGLSSYPFYLDFQNDGTLFITGGNGLCKLFTNGMRFQGLIKLKDFLNDTQFNVFFRNLGKSLYSSWKSNWPNPKCFNNSLGNIN